MPVQMLDEFSPGTPGGVCFVCKASRRSADKVIDFFVDVEGLNWVVPTAEYLGWEIAGGFLQVCSSCITEAANLLGMLSAQKAEEQAAQIVALVGRARDATERAEAADQALAAVRAYDAVTGAA